MDTPRIPIENIVELDTQIAASGAIEGDVGSSSTWEQIIAIVASIRAPDAS